MDDSFNQTTAEDIASRFAKTFIYDEAGSKVGCIDGEDAAPVTCAGLAASWESSNEYAAEFGCPANTPALLMKWAAIRTDSKDLPPRETWVTFPKVFEGLPVYYRAAAIPRIQPAQHKLTKEEVERARATFFKKYFRPIGVIENGDATRVWILGLMATMDPTPGGQALYGCPAHEPAILVDYAPADASTEERVKRWFATHPEDGTGETVVLPHVFEGVRVYYHRSDLPQAANT